MGKAPGYEAGEGCWPPGSGFSPGCRGRGRGTRTETGRGAQRELIKWSGGAAVRGTEHPRFGCCPG